MTKSRHVVVLGNCQAQILEGMFATGNSSLAIASLPPVFELNATHQQLVLEAFDRADLIFVQRVAEDYHLEWVRPRSVKERFADKTVIWPNIYFSGYFPDANYLYLQSYGKLQGPLDDYHLDRVLSAFRRGQTVAETASALLDPDRQEDETAFEMSLENLRDRERDVDATISDFIEAEVYAQRCFYTPNHPHNSVLAEMARRLLEHVGLPFDLQRAAEFPYRLNKIDIPVYPHIARLKRLSFNEAPIYKGVDVEYVDATSLRLGRAVEMTAQQLVECFFRVYDKSFPGQRGPGQQGPGRQSTPRAPMATAKRKKRVGLVGYYGYGNYGDELFRSVFDQALPEIDFHVLDVPRLATDQAYHGWFSSEIDAVVIGGGDLLIPSGWASWYFADQLLAKSVFIFGVGVPTWAGLNDEAVRNLRRFVRHPNIRLLVVRDVDSSSWVEEYLGPQVPTQVFPDIVCALELPEVVRSEEQRIFSLITREQRSGEINWTNIAALCDRARSFGYRIRNVILGTGETAKQDMGILTKEAEAFDWQLITAENNEVLTRAIGESSVVASMKFHGCVVAAMFGIPAIGLSTTDKFTSFFRLIERLDLRAHHTHADLPERLAKYPVVVPRSTISSLRSGAKSGLEVLKVALAECLMSA